MTRWARLTWQSADPTALAADLRRRLGVEASAWVGPPGALVIGLGDAGLELVPWRHEAPADHPTVAGRLVFEPNVGDLPEPAGGPEPSVRLVGVGWATVDLDRAEAELHEWLEGPGDDHAGAADGTGDQTADGTEPHLGARTRVREAPGLPGSRLVLAEPVTEGRLAASLARDGEGPCALYLAPRGGLEPWRLAARGRGVVLTALRPGPLGRSVLVPGGSVAGPHLIVVDPPAVQAAGSRAAGTIDP